MPSAFLTALVPLLSIALARGFTPLVSKRVPWDQIPYKVDTDVGLIRGDQLGYNICNSTTEGPTSLCQTAYINSLDDFCIWAPPNPGKTVGEIEGEMIAWCTKPGHGTRVMPEGTLTGVQLTKTPDYIQVVGFMDQTKINMVAGDEGGEMDPHGADQRGNPMGGLVYTNAFTGTYTQVIEWHNFNGGNYFCFKACDPRGKDDAKFCQHIYDTQGCGFNAPSNAKDKVFESCAGDSQAFPGVGPPVVPSSFSCSQYQSTDIYLKGTQVPVPGASTISFSSTPTPSLPSTKSSQSPTSGATTGSKTNSGSSAPSQTSNAGAIAVPAIMSMAGLLLPLLLLN
ncbi:hypothetical protein JR316_0011138 [Psilocybe cubensis]|uniref:Uncharacterized protein n=2 Tax=Psilocybe cubensis TaxID=181762 RepID=A0ACB8GNR4_PSICU|nr:hypothetical protein JR316_0011138 [Psilocybe cubensis]KAH9477219.1 hypothetical protein JR316_0011138 [Psilocybe cubensis]